MVNNVFIALGSNKGDRYRYIADAIKRICNNDQCSLIAVSSIYETTPYGEVKQENFFNAVIEIETSFSLIDLFRFVKEVEFKVGRKETVLRWGPREIDVDIIFYNNLIYGSDILTVPHKDCLKRDFVMTPLIEIADHFVHPMLNIRLNEIDISKMEKHIIRKLDYSYNR